MHVYKYNYTSEMHGIVGARHCGGEPERESVQDMYIVTELIMHAVYWMTSLVIMVRKYVVMVTLFDVSCSQLVQSSCVLPSMLGIVQIVQQSTGKYNEVKN